jgi:hypothetical protein
MYIFLIFVFILLLSTFLLNKNNTILQENFGSKTLSENIQKSYDLVSELNRKLDLVDFNSPNNNVKIVPVIDIKNQTILESVDNLITALPQLIANLNYTTTKSM